jgi:aspartate/methionine/tyrosine aminotransferase
MTGWRLGWLIAPKNIINTIEKLSMSLFLCPPTFSQLIAVKALEDYDILNNNVLIYKKNRDLLINFFEGIGFNKYAPADGAFYLYLDVSKITDDSANLAIRLLKEAGVSSTPGADFDYRFGNKFIRFSYGGAHKEIVEGTKRIYNWVKNKN